MISLYLAQHTPPPGVRFVLWVTRLRATISSSPLVRAFPGNIANQVILVDREYDGWSDSPTNTGSPNYQLAMQNAEQGAATIHNYVDAQLDNSANVVTTRGNITSILIPTQHLPLNNSRRSMGSSTEADRLDAQQRPLIDSAYNRPAPTPDQLAESTGEQVANH